MYGAARASGIFGTLASRERIVDAIPRGPSEVYLSWLFPHTQRAAFFAGSLPQSHQWLLENAIASPI